MDGLVDEIRINSQYAQLVQAEYDQNNLKDGDSIPVIRKSVTPTNEYLKKMTSGFDHNQGMLPPNCRYIEKVTNGTLVVIEEPPAYRTIQVAYSMAHEVDVLEADNKIEEWGIDAKYYRDSNNIPWRFNLAMPYVIHVLMFDNYDALMSGQVFLRNARLSGPADYLLKMPMMNISSDGWICYGDKAGGKRGSLMASIEHTIMVFWSATFCSDYTYNYSAYKDVAGVNTYIGWQALSQIDPMFIYNVEWIKETNFKDAIDKSKRRHESRSKVTLQYEQLHRVFTQPADLEKEEVVRKSSRSQRTARLFYDIAQGVYLDDRFFFHVGDSIQWGKHLAYVDSFIGFFDSEQVRIIRLELDNGKFITTRFNNKVREYLYEAARKMRFEEQGTLKNGEVIKENDIIVLSRKGHSDVYKKVHFIRKARDGVTEARLGSSFYILENTEGKVLDVNAPTYKGMDIKKDEKYLIFTNTNHVPFHQGHEVVYDGINVDRFGGLRMDFKGIGGRSDITNIGMSEPDHYPNRLYAQESYRPLPGIFRVGRKIIATSRHGKISGGNAWATQEGIVQDSHCETTTPTIDEIATHLLSKEGTKLSCESFDLNIEFEVGDKVIYADWKNPMNMLIPRTITAFIIDKEKQSLNIVLADKEGRLTQVEYIQGTSSRSSSNRAGIISVGRVRKITNVFGRVTAGTKIIAEKGYIPHFPKKDVNIIIGFITDTGGDDPLVLCSNCCTLWYSDVMANFKRVTIKSKKWATLAHAPIDITKIKSQPGDIIAGVSDYQNTAGWLVGRQRGSRVPKISTLNNFTSYPDQYSLDNYTRSHTILDCIPNPRLSPTDQSKMKTVPAWPNFHGLFIESKLSQFEFCEDERSLLHVSDLHK